MGSHADEPGNGEQDIENDDGDNSVVDEGRAEFGCSEIAIWHGSG